MPWVAQNNRHADVRRVGLSVIALEDWQLGRQEPQEKEQAREGGKDAHGQREKRIDGCEALQYALVDGASILAWISEDGMQQETANTIDLYVRTHAQVVVSCKLDFSGQVPAGSIVLNQAQRLNCEVTVGPEKFPWAAYSPMHPNPELAWFSVEVRPRFYYGNDLVVNRDELRKIVAKSLWGLKISLHERFIIKLQERHFLIRVTAMDSFEDLDEEEDCGGGGGGDSDQSASAAYLSKKRGLVVQDIDRGIVAARTKVFLEQATWAKGAVFDMRGGPEPSRPTKKQTNMIDIYCNDQEWFPVKKRLLQPCLVLAKHVLSESSERESVNVDLDCCSFDKVLRYLEAEALEEDFDFELHETDQLLHAAKTLKLVGLQRLCEKAVGEYRSSIRSSIPWEEVVARNAAGEMLLVIDGCVCNVSTWLEHHPGGNTIIPEQAINVDATVLFELYHASRESFVFLQQLYIGRLSVQDVAKVPPPTAHRFAQTRPSESFLEQLRTYLGTIKLFKSF